MSQQADDPGDLGSEWFGGRRWTGYAAIAVAALVAVSALIWWQGRGGVPPASSTSRGTAPTAPSAATPSAVGLDNSDQRVPTSPPSEISWQVWHAIALPYSRTAGPSRAEGQAVSGFAHTPTGALIAVLHASSRKTAALDPGWREVVQTMVAPGPGRDAWITNRSKITVTAAPAAGSFAQYAGFQFVTYTPDDAVIQLVTRTSDGSLSVINEHAIWLSGDWKLVLAADGGDATSMQRLSSMEGFIAWGGV